MSMHHRDTQTSNVAGFVPKGHAAILLLGFGSYKFLDRQGVEFEVDLDAAQVPFYLPVSVTKMTVTPSAGAIFLA